MFSFWKKQKTVNEPDIVCNDFQVASTSSLEKLVSSIPAEALQKSVISHLQSKGATNNAYKFMQDCCVESQRK